MRRTVGGAATAALVWILMIVGCGGDRQDDPLSRVHDLRGVPVSPALDAALADVRDLLATPPPVPGTWPAQESYENLLPRIDRVGERAEAAAALAAHLRDDPDNFLWHQLARTNRNLLRAHLDYGELQAAADSARPVTRAFVHALYARDRNERDEAFLALDRDAPDLAPLSRCELVRRQAEARARQGDAETAVRQLLDFLPEARAAGGGLETARLWRSVRLILLKDDRLDDALHAACATIALARRADAPYQELGARLGLAEVLTERGELEAAYATLDTCVADARAGDYPWLLNYGLNRAAALHAERGDLAAALSYDRQTVALARAMRDTFGLVQCLSNVAYDLRQGGDLDASRHLLDEGRRLVAAYPHPDLVAGFAMKEVPYFLHVGDYATADSLMQVALGAVPEATLASQEAELHLDQLRAGLDMGRPDLAYRAQERLEHLRYALHDRLADSNRAAEYDLATADLLMHQGEYSGASAALDEAAAAVARTGGEGMAWSVDRCRGDLALLRGDVASARDAFAACLARARADDDPTRVAESRVRLGTTLLELGRAAEAREVLTAVGEVGVFGPRFRSRLAARLFAAVALARAGSPAAARAELEDLVAGLRPQTPADLAVRAHLELARLCARLGDTPAAAAHLDTAGERLRAADDRLFADELRLPNRRLRRELVETMVGFALDTAEGGDPDVAVRTWSMTDLARPGPRWDAEPGDGPQLRFFVGEDRSFRWWGRGDRLQVAALPGRDSLLTLVVPVVADVEQPAHAPDPKAMQRLAAVLWSGLDAVWGPGETLSLAPDGVLGAVPWPALPLPPLPGAPPAVERGPVAEGPCGATRPARSPQHLLVLGDDRPSPHGGGAALHHAEDEAAAVAALWPDAEVTLRLGEAAGAVEPTAWADYDVVHLASHARFSEGLPRRATLRLPAGIPLTASALRRLELRTDLIYMSCCEAARPMAVSGLGSFARACLDAGAGTVIASGLRVDDAAAAELATRFYRNWQAGRGKAEALHAARLELRADHPEWSHPYYWASYRLIGDPH